MKKLILLTLCFIAAPALALSPQSPIEGQAVVAKVVEADTLNLAVMDVDVFNRIAEIAPAKADRHLARNPRIMRVQLSGVDTPDIETGKGRHAKRRVTNWVSHKKVSFRCFDFDRYGHPICHVKNQDRDLGEQIIGNGLSSYSDQYGSDPFHHAEYTQADQ